jgi:large repetitive protein
MRPFFRSAFLLIGPLLAVVLMAFSQSATAINTTISFTVPSVSAGSSFVLSANVSGQLPNGSIASPQGGSVTFGGLGTVNVSNGLAQISISNLGAGSHTVTASFSGYQSLQTWGASSGSVTFVVNKAASNTVLTLAPAGAATGTPVTLTASVSGFNPTGKVSFSEGSIALGEANLSGGAASINVSTLSAGPHTLTATYEGDGNNLGSSSSFTALIKAVSGIVLGPSSGVVGRPVTFTATVSGSSPTGTVTFKDAGQVLGAATLANGVASLTTTPLAAGVHSISAIYSGDASNAAINSPVQSLTILSIAQVLQPIINLLLEPSATTTTLASNLNPAPVGQAIVFTATVVGTQPTGSVSFFDGGILLGSASVINGKATLTKSYSMPGKHSLTAKYSGDNNNSDSISTGLDQFIVPPSEVDLWVSASNVMAGQPTVFNIAVDGDNPTGTITIVENGAVVATGTLASGSLTLSATLSPGPHTLTAKYSGDAHNIAGTSSSITVHVGNITLESDHNPAALAQVVTYKVKVFGYQPTGTVTFYDNGTSLGTATVSGGIATITTTYTSASLHSIVANYSGDANNAPSSSAALIQTAAPANMSTKFYEYDAAGRLKHVR